MMSLRPLISIAAIISVGSSVCASELYNLDFQPPEAGTYITIFGSPTIQSSVGPFDRALVFDAVAQYEQIKLPVDVTAPVYRIGFDVLVHGLQGSMYAYTVLLDMLGSPYPGVRTFSFHGLFDAIEMINLGRVSPFSDDVAYHWEIVADFSGNRLSLTIDQAETFSTTINASALSSIRFNMGPWRSGSADAPGAYAALDNVRVTAVPEPSSFSLLSIALLIVVIGIARKCRINLWRELLTR